MDAETYRFEIGAFHCLAVCDGTFVCPPGEFFINALKEDYEAALAERDLPVDEITTPYVCLYLDTGEHRVLVDTGAGMLAPTTGRLAKNLLSHRVDAVSVDTVILTHPHPDHIGGNLDSNRARSFPNARYLMSRDEWDFWTSKPDLSTLKCGDHLEHLLLQYAADMLPPIQHRVEFIDGETEVIPGFRAIEAPGHTPGHLALAIGSQGETLIDAVDAVLHPIVLEHLDWYSAVDLLPERAVGSRRRVLERAVEVGAVLMAFHFPFPGLVRVTRKQQGYTSTRIV
jgi:glyoxylase-like metal-dependent hydrolase (beta-lactamase superfamily II)